MVHGNISCGPAPPSLHTPAKRKLFSRTKIAAGRQPKPTLLKLVEGNSDDRAINETEPKPRREIPSCPAHPDHSVKVAWGRLLVLRDRMGVLIDVDGLRSGTDAIAPQTSSLAAN